uniref:C2H2-type domain-containing protein n=1 Tax=Timema douglasi TaxID=61478 RepID=A0A7R8ZH84_TIMDO|nr:unnamed protein product [Timema douglasi]
MYGLHDIVPGSDLTGSTTHSTRKFKIKRRFKERVKVNKNRSNAREEGKTENIIEDPTVFSDKLTNTSFLQQVIKEIEHDRRKPISKDGKGDNLPKLTPSSSNKSTLVKQEIFKCNDCNKCFSRKQNFVEHYRVHSKLKPYTCKECGKGFSTSSNLKRHVTIHRNGQIKYKCDKCGTLFNQADHLSEHLHVHRTPDPRESEESSKTSLLHNLMNSQQKPHKCEACGKGFITPSKLERHNLIHSGEKPHRCEECGRCFSQVSHLRGHLLVHSAQINDKLGTASLGTASSATLKLIHGLIQNQQKQFKCEECGKDFVTRSKLNRHGFRHTGQKPHKCDVCGKYFGDVGNLRQHLVIHSGVKPFKCEVCGKCFNVKKNLRRHGVVHGGQPS